MRIAQANINNNRKVVGKIEDKTFIVLREVNSTYQLANNAVIKKCSMTELADQLTGDEYLDYNELLHNKQILPPVDHPDPARFWITGTGLTHLGSASARDKMHMENKDIKEQTDSMKMFEIGIKGGKPKGDRTGAQPEWFYKGNGTMIIPPGGSLPSPEFALLDGDEIEICGLYLIGPDGTPYRLGYALGNEFSDHRMEKINYLYLAHSKLRHFSFGPELLLDHLPDHVEGVSRIIRNDRIVWEEKFLSGEKNMCHSITNLEYHHFKYDIFRQAGDVHCHCFGTATASFSGGFEPQSGDVFEMQVKGFGAHLRNILDKKTKNNIKIHILH